LKENGKTVFVIIDGLADSIKQKRTALEAANPRNLNWFARNGKTGMVYTVGKGIAPESDAAVLSVLGYAPFRHNTARGPLEALGAGMKIGKGIALRANFATARNGKIIDRRVGRSLGTKESEKLALEVNAKTGIGKRFEFRATAGHRGVLVISGNFSPNVGNTDPAYERRGLVGIISGRGSESERKCIALGGSEKTRKTAQAINEFVLRSRKALEESEVNARRRKRGLPEANLILLRGAGTILPKLEPIGEKTGMKWCAVAGMPLEKGIARATGMKEREFCYPENTGGKYWDWAERRAEKCAKEALRAIAGQKDCNAFYVHFKETDEAGHEGNAEEKARLVSAIDKRFFGKLRKILDGKKDRLIVTADHATPTSIKRHSADAVPLLVWGRNAKAEGNGFSERECAKGGIGFIRGGKVILYIK